MTVLGILERLPLLQEPNPRLILRLVREEEGISRADLARRTGLHPSTITRIVASLIEEGLLREGGEGHNELGRKPIVLSLVDDAVHAVGVAVESTFVAGVLVNLGARVMDRIEVDFGPDTSQDAVLENTYRVVNELLNRAGERVTNPVGVGVAVHGMVDSTRGISLFAPAFRWRDLPLAALIEEHCGLPVRIENNARAMALGEYWFGSGRGLQHLLAVKVGEAIGSGIILNSQLFAGTVRRWEIGHTTVVSDGVLCNCGNYGCLETEASIKAVLRKLRVILKGVLAVVCWN